VDNKPSSASIDSFDELKSSHDTELVSFSLGTENTHVPELQDKSPSICRSARMAHQGR
jgi:hypothetical protein